MGFNSKKRRADRKRAQTATVKLHRKGILRVNFEKWKRLFVSEATTKMALLHWANRIEVETFVRWRRYSEWSLRSTLSADKTHRGHTLKRCFALWLDEFTPNAKRATVGRDPSTQTVTAHRERKG